MGADLEFCILGPLEVRRRDDRVAIPAMRGALLALLLLRRGETVGFETLIDALWGEEPPATARTALQVHASKLRQSLAKLGARDVLVTHGTGYAIEVPPEAVDLERFLMLTDQAGTALADDPARAEQLLDRALALWRGPILAGIDVPGIDVWDLDIFEERRDDALIMRLEAFVLQDRAAEAAGELDRMRAKRPLDERVGMLAARAWARVGRKPEALAALARLRQALSEELGMEPGPAVGELETAILRDDPSVGPILREEEARRAHRRMLTALVCRMRSGSAADPEMTAAADEATARFTGEIAERFGGLLATTPSGRFTMVFGLPDLHEDDAVRAVRAAWELRASVPEARIGVATMEALFEADANLERTIGGPVDAADELARRALHGEVLISQETLRLTRAAVGAEPTEVISLGDEGDAITAFRVHDVAATETARRLRAPLVGRADELELLRRIQQRSVGDGRAHLVTLVGPAGIGKSRLVEEFAATLPPGVMTLTGRCLPYERGMTLWALAQVVREAAGIRDDLGPKAARHKVAAMFAHSQDAAFLSAQMDVLLGLSDAPVEPDELSWATRRCLETVAATHPLVLVIEDLHWGTDAFLDLVDYLATAIAAPVTIVATTRPELFERRGAWGSGSGSGGDRVALETLPPAATDELLTALLSGGGLDPHAHERVAAAAQGNPLFIEELLSVLVDDGHLQMRNGRWESVTDLATVPVPPTVRALMDARLDLLPARSRALLEAAAIVGYEFTERDVASLATDLDAQVIGGALDDLARRDLIVLERSTRADGRAYRFHHLLMRDATYAGTPKVARARDHERFAHALRARAGERLAEVEELVGHHFASALDLRLELGAEPSDVHELRSLAAAHLAAAGLRAAQRDDVQASADLLLSALSAAPAELDGRAMLTWHLAQALIALGRFPEAERAIDGGLAEAERTDDRAAAWRLRLARGEVGTWTDPDAYPADQIADGARAAIGELTALDDAVGAAWGYRVLGDSAFRAGSMELAFEAYREGRSWAEAAGDAPGKPSWPVASTIHGPVHVDLYIEEAERDLEGATRPRPEALFRLALAYAIADRDDDARAAIARARDRVHEVGGTYRAADGELHAGLALLYLGAIDEAEAALRASADGLGSIGERNERSTALAMLAEARIKQGDDDGARAAVSLSAELTAEDDPVSAMAWRAATAKLDSRGGDHETALALCVEAVAIGAGTDLLLLTADVFTTYSEVLEASGHHAEAQAKLRRAIELYERKGSRSGLRAARAVSP